MAHLGGGGVKDVLQDSQGGSERKQARCDITLSIIYSWETGGGRESLGDTHPPWDTPGSSSAQKSGMAVVSGKLH